MENPIIVPFDLNTARKIKSGEIEGSVLIGNIKIEFVYESKDCADRYNLLFVKKDESGISAIYADTEGRTFFNNVLELEVEAGAYFKKGDVLISTLGNPFIYNGIINREGDMGCIYGISAYGEITSEEVPIWTSVCGEDKSKYVRLATEEEKKSFAERIANTENLKKAGIIKQYLSEYEYLLTKEKKCDFKPFDQVLVRASNLGNWNLHLFARVREEEYKYECLGGLRYKECIPYQGNEHLLGTNPSEEDKKESTDGLYIIYEDGHAEPFTGDNSKDCVRYIGLKHRYMSFAISLTEHDIVQLLDDDSREESGSGTYYERECDALFDIDGRGNTERLVARNPKLRNLLEDGEYIPSLGQLNLMAHYMNELNKAFAYVSASPLSSTWYWSSTESSQAVAWYVVFSSGLTGTGNKHIGDMVRAVIDF